MISEKGREMDNTRLAVGDKIRVERIYGDTTDLCVEEFRQCLGVFVSEAHRQAQDFKPLCDLYGSGPETQQKYISNYGEYFTNQVPLWMNIPSDDKRPEAE